MAIGPKDYSKIEVFTYRWQAAGLAIMKPQDTLIWGLCPHVD